ncbi:hypothetical protein ABK040_010387 [Willaertia magna]
MSEQEFYQLLISCCEAFPILPSTKEDLWNDHLNYGATNNNILFNRYQNLIQNKLKYNGDCTMKIFLSNLQNCFRLKKNLTSTFYGVECKLNFINAIKQKSFLVDELWVNIALFLKDNELLDLALCCKEFYELFFVNNLYFWKLKLLSLNINLSNEIIETNNYLELYKLFKEKFCYPLNDLRPIDLQKFIQKNDITQNLLTQRICFMNETNCSTIGMVYINSNHIITNDIMIHDNILSQLDIKYQMLSLYTLGVKFITILIGVINLNHLDIINNSFVDLKNVLFEYTRKVGYNIQMGVSFKIINPFTLKGIIKNPLQEIPDHDSVIDKLNDSLNLMDDLVNFSTKIKTIRYPNDRNLRASILHILNRSTPKCLTVIVGVSSGTLKKHCDIQLVTKDKVYNARITRINKCIFNSKEVHSEEEIDSVIGKSVILSVDICIIDNIVTDNLITAGVLIYQRDENLSIKSSALVQLISFEELKPQDVLLISGTHFDLFGKVKEFKQLIDKRTGRSIQDNPLQIGKNECGIVEIEFINKTLFNQIEAFINYPPHGRLVIRSIPPEILQNMVLDEVTIKMIKETVAVTQVSIVKNIN